MSIPITETGKVNVVVECAILAKDHILMQMRNSNNQSFINYWTTPGGHIDDLENALEAAVREIEEETGLVLKAEQLTMREFAINKHPTRGKVYIVIGFVAKLDEMLPARDSFEGECKWIALSDLDKYEVMEPVRKFIKIALDDGDKVVHLADTYEIPEIK